jgi:hypothetical protein
MRAGKLKRWRLRAFVDALLCWRITDNPGLGEPSVGSVRYRPACRFLRWFQTTSRSKWSDGQPRILLFHTTTTPLNTWTTLRVFKYMCRHYVELKNLQTTLALLNCAITLSRSYSISIAAVRTALCIAVAISPTTESLDTSPTWTHLRLGHMSDLDTCPTWTHLRLGHISDLDTSPTWIHPLLGYISDAGTYLAWTHVTFDLDTSDLVTFWPSYILT